MPIMTFGLNNLQRIYPVVLITGAVTPMFFYKPELIKALVESPTAPVLAWQLFLAAGAIGLASAVAAWLIPNTAGWLKLADYFVGKLFPPNHPKWVLLIVFCGSLGGVVLYVVANILNAGKFSPPPWIVSYGSIWLMMYRAVDSENAAPATQEESASISVSG